MKVTSSSTHPQKAFKWMQEVDSSTATHATLANSGKFKSLDTKLSSAINDIARGELGRQITIATEKEAKEGRLIKGRQLLLIIFEYFKLDEAAGSLYDLTDLMAVRMKGDNPSGGQLEAFYSTWESTFLNMKEEPTEKVSRSSSLRTHTRMLMHCPGLGAL